MFKVKSSRLAIFSPCEWETALILLEIANYTLDWEGENFSLLHEEV
jgi:hypothetical protein